MNYQTFTPPEMLKPFIKYFWALEGNAADNAVKTFSAIPDGCPGVIMVQSDKEAFCMDNNKKLPNIFYMVKRLLLQVFHQRANCVQPASVFSHMR